MPCKTKEALSSDVCLDCRQPLEVIDTWERIAVHRAAAILLIGRTGRSSRDRMAYTDSAFLVVDEAAEVLGIGRTKTY